MNTSDYTSDYTIAETVNDEQGMTYYEVRDAANKVLIVVTSRARAESYIDRKRAYTGPSAEYVAWKQVRLREHLGVHEWKRKLSVHRLSTK